VKTLEPPASVTLEGQRVKITFVSMPRIKTGHPTLGEFKDWKVKMHPGMTANDERATLMHELLHAIKDRSQLSITKELEEYVFSCIDTWLVVLLRENPALVEYLVAP
jgi:hypothetical protein